MITPENTESISVTVAWHDPAAGRLSYTFEHKPSADDAFTAAVVAAARATAKLSPEEAAAIWRMAGL